MNADENEITLYAWIGEDELGSGRVGLKQGIVPAGRIPLVAMGYDRHKLERGTVREQLEAQAATYGKRIKFCRFVMVEVVDQTREGA